MTINDTRNVRSFAPIPVLIAVLFMVLLIVPLSATAQVAIANTTSDENGNYTFSDLPAGNYTIEVAYYTPAMGGKWFVGNNNTTVSAGAHQDELDVWLTFGNETDALEIVNAIIDPSAPSGTSTISGRTLAHGMGGSTMTMTNATVLLVKTDESGDPPSQPENMTVLAKTISDENGNYTFSDLPAGNYTIEVAYYTPAMGGKWFVGNNNTTVSAGAHQDELDVWLTFGNETDALEIVNAIIDPSAPSGTSTISGRTLAEGMGGATTVMDNATVLLIKTDESGDPPSQPENMTVLAKTISDENGNYTFSDLPAGDYVINVAYYTPAMGGTWFIGNNNTSVSAGEHQDGLDVWLTFGEETDALETVNAIVDSGGASGTSTISGQTVAYDRLGSVRTMTNATVIINSYLKGDLNADALLTSADAFIALQMAVGSREPDLVGDMNLDGAVTSLDALMILQAGLLGGHGQQLRDMGIVPGAASFKAVTVDGEDLYYEAFDGSGNKIGYGFIAEVPGSQDVMTIAGGMDLDLKMTGVKVLAHKETPGIGDKVVLVPEFAESFVGVGLDGLALTTDGGQIDSISGATQSSKAVTDGARGMVEKIQQEVG